MKSKASKFVIRGMQKDLSISKFNPEFAFDNMNIRLTARESNTLLSVSNEKGTAKVPLLEASEDYSPSSTETIIIGNYIGYGLLGNFLLLFTHQKGATSNPDRIYRLEYFGKDSSNEYGRFSVVLIYNGNLNFSQDNPIESICIYENEDIQKIYWTDNRNQPRVLNFSNKSISETTFTDNFFDFVPKLKLEETVTVQRQSTSLGSFPSGTIQYAFTYFNEYGQESNIFYQSPLLYASPNGRGGSPEEKNNSAFYIEIQNPDTSFSYIRIYSILRTSIDDTPTVKIVIDLSTENVSTREEDEVTIEYISYTDRGDSGTTIDPTELLYVGGESILAGTISYKDQTLFLGDITLERSTVPDDVVSALKDSSGENGVYFPLNTNDNSRGYWKNISYNNITGKYPYTNSLKLSSEDIKIFKSREVYRFGVQLQDDSGRWSEVIYLKDLRNDLKIETGNDFTDESNDITVRVPMPAYVIGGNALNTIRSAGYRKIRGVVVYPSLTSRETVMQGILCPTVYNVNDRYNNAPYAVASWFARPYLPFNQSEATWQDFHSTKDSYYSSKGMWESDPSSITFGDDVAEQGFAQWNKDNLVLSGASLEFRHNYAIPGVKQNNTGTDFFPRNAEIQCLVNPPQLPFLGYKSSITGGSAQDYVSRNGEYYYIDQSIQTFHSPDFEFDNSLQNLDLSNLKLRIVGMTLMSSTTTDVEILTSTVGNNIEWSMFYHEPIGTQNLSYVGLKGLISGLLWLDTIYDLSGTAKTLIPWLENNTIGFAIYPWHRNGSLNNMGIPGDGSTRQALLKQKKMSNLRFSWNNIYFDTAWTDNTTHSIPWLSTENTTEFLDSSVSTQMNRAYTANVDKILSITNTNIDTQRKRSSGYPIIVGETLENAIGNPTITEFTSNHEKFCAPYLNFLNKVIIGSGTGTETIVTENHLNNMYGTDPVSIKYKSTPHIVVSFDSNYANTQVVAPTIYSNKNTNKLLNSANNLFGTNKVFWDDELNNVEQPVIDISQDTRLYNNGVLKLNYGYFWLAELYNDSFPDLASRFGGNTEEALQSNTWYVGGAPESLYDKDGNPKSTIKVRFTEGDTYYQRYDNLKTYPFTLEDQNSVTDIVSFMCETRVNIDGRYDRNRGKDNNLVMTPTNFNLLNDVYSQRNNFFNVSYLNRSRFNLDKFSNVITWTKNKIFGSLVDTWTNITLASTLDMDGDKGKVRALRRFNNDIYCFQDRGISKILFNSRVQIPTSDGVPIELGNSAKVDGKVYLVQDIGCINKWSICETPSGLYFIDNLSNSIFLFNGGLKDLSNELGFRSWISNNNSTTPWSIVDSDNFVSYYDVSNGDTYFINKNYCLGYSEPLGQFSSFYSYENIPLMFNMQGELFSLNNNSLWKHEAGDYNMFYGTYKPYHVEIIANEEEHIEKIFNTVEYRADCFSNDTYIPNASFDKLYVKNEYQEGSATLTNTNNIPSNLKKKFRIWRANIPRDSNNGRDRMRNPWLSIKLAMEKENTYRMELHDIMIHYFG